MGRASTEAVTADPAGLPFDLAARAAGARPGAGDAVLLLHGLSGSPFEVRFLAEALADAGMRCVGPLLPGHGGAPAALAGVAWRDWVAAGKDALLGLRGARRTFVAGCSMGGLVALALAHELPHRVDGLVLLAPALRLSPLGALAGLLARRTALGRILPPLPKGASDVADPEMRRRNPCLQAIPIAAVGELLDLAEHVDRILPGVDAPALVFAGGRDHTVRLAGAERIARRIGSAPARLLVLPDSQHLVGIDVERELVADETLAFLSRIPAHGRVE